MPIRIDKDIPPPEIRGAGRPAKYPWRELEINDSFVMPGVTIDRAQSHCSTMGRNLGKKFIARFDRHRIRVWRVL